MRTGADPAEGTGELGHGRGDSRHGRDSVGDAKSDDREEF